MSKNSIIVLQIPTDIFVLVELGMENMPLETFPS
jgi:hypothetical protein